MSETETVTPQSQATQSQATQSQATPTGPGLVSRLREAGDAGRKQWEEIFAQVRALRDEQLPRLRQGAQESLERLRQDGPFVRAQLRGTELLLQLVSRVREGAAQLEQSLRHAPPAAAERETAVTA